MDGDQRPATKLIIAVETHESLLGEDAKCLRVKKNALEPFEASIQLIWYYMTNPKDRPLKYNKGLLPLARLYESGAICLDRYVGRSELLGEKIVCRFTYHSAGEIQIVDGNDAPALINAINERLEAIKLNIAFELV
jgi:hypothetical protein